ncbi:MAG: hypothetical protein KIT80_03445 [Chitinophagaceae bacterium]|nr:hypothetical protein [Chitinophagaceae bacterium]MCW5925941.1 hypothetical protein [Chitinophagaceae bacterium]
MQENGNNCFPANFPVPETGNCMAAGQKNHMLLAQEDLLPVATAGKYYRPVLSRV